MSDMHKRKVSFHYSRGQGNYKKQFEFKLPLQMPNSLGDSKFRFKQLCEESNSDKSYNNNIEENATFMNTFDQKLNFSYYQNHQFHKLVNKLPENKTFSLLHTNICSLQGNFGNLQNLITNLGHKFSVIEVSETWTPNNDKSGNKPQTLEGYQNYHGVKGKSLQNGCGFYVKEGINFKPRKDLEITYSDEDNEFQCSWIELLNEKRLNILVEIYYRHPKRSLITCF